MRKIGPYRLLRKMSTYRILLYLILHTICDAICHLTSMFMRSIRLYGLKIVTINMNLLPCPCARYEYNSFFARFQHTGNLFGTNIQHTGIYPCVKYDRTGSCARCQHTGSCSDYLLCHRCAGKEDM